MPAGAPSSSFPNLAADALAAFERDGFLRVPGAFARADALTMQDEWWAELAEVHGIFRSDRSTWRQPRGDLKRPKTAPSQGLIQTEAVRTVIDGLLGAGAWDWPRDWGRPIVTFPSGAAPEAWDVPERLWHWDGTPAWNAARLTTLFVVGFVGEVRPAGGGTLVLAGSPRLILKQYEAQAPSAHRADGSWRRDRLHRSHPWLAALTGCAAGPPDRIEAFMADGAEVDGVGLRVVELTGEPGDMVLCHPLLLHCVAPNCRDVPRFMRIKQQLMSHAARRLLKAQIRPKARA
ncbi:MAG TPA: hypothetical protein VMU93_15485 [Caulobacteraceae bacterium]|nr:hypothetical protein [Caulobacteraceae bacterium]